MAGSEAPAHRALRHADPSIHPGAESRRANRGPALLNHYPVLMTTCRGFWIWSLLALLLGCSEPVSRVDTGQDTAQPAVEPTVLVVTLKGMLGTMELARCHRTLREAQSRGIGWVVFRLDWSGSTTLTFEPPDRAAFPCLDLAYEAGRAGGLAPAWLNAANEVAVAAFLAGRIRWVSIPAVLRSTLEEYEATAGDSVDEVIEVDGLARRSAEQTIERMAA